MFFLWPQYLWLMLAVPALPVAYVWLLRRRNRQAVRYSSVRPVREASRGRQWRRHLPPLLLLLACSALLFASSRPVTRIPLPWSRSTIILALDESVSMRGTDVKPTRVAAGTRHGAVVRLTGLTALASLDAFSAWLARPGPWVAGFDLPFGLPRELVAQLGWPTH